MIGYFKRSWRFTVSPCHQGPARIYPWQKIERKVKIRHRNNWPTQN